MGSTNIWVERILSTLNNAHIGPLLFTLFINDLTDLFDSSTTSKLFADDIKIYSEISINCNLDMFQIHLDAIHNWAKIWQIGISFSKCNLIVIGNLSACPDYKLSEHIISKVDNVRDLGCLRRQQTQLQNSDQRHYYSCQTTLSPYLPRLPITKYMPPHSCLQIIHSTFTRIRFSCLVPFPDMPQWRNWVSATILH